MLCELGVLTTGTASGAAAAELRAASTDTIYVREIGIYLNAATASTLGLGRPANTPAGGTVTVGQQTDQDDAAAVGGIVLSGWTTAPTAPTNNFRRIALPATIGVGVVFSWWDRPLRVKQSSSLVIWNLALNSALNLYVVWEE